MKLLFQRADLGFELRLNGLLLALVGRLGLVNLVLAVIEGLGIREMALHGAWPGALMFAGAIIYDVIGALTILRATYARRLPEAPRPGLGRPSPVARAR